MGLFGNMIKNAVSSGISRGINKGISNAVSSATEKIVAPKVDAYANSVADSFDEASKSLDEATAAGRESRENSATAEGKENKTTSLEQSLDRWAKSMERYAKTVEGSYAEQTAGLDKWEELLPGFPVWPFGGRDFSIEVRYVDEPTGSLFYEFRAVGATYEELEKYVQILKKEGFVQKYKGADASLYKDLGGGEYLGFGSTEAFNDLDVMCIALGRTKSLNEV